MESSIEKKLISTNISNVFVSRLILWLWMPLRDWISLSISSFILLSFKSGIDTQIFTIWFGEEVADEYNIIAEAVISVKQIVLIARVKLEIRGANIQENT